jgi:hypothetical protein
MYETAQRLITLLRILQLGPPPFGALGDDAVLDAWFGKHSPLFHPDPDSPDPSLPAPASL